MATIAGSLLLEEQPDRLSGTQRAHAIDRWIYVFMAAFFILIVLGGFIPDSVGALAAIKAGARPPFSPVAHVHAVLMGSFLLLLLVQTILVAVGWTQFHRQLGLVAMVLVPALVTVGLFLAPTVYHSVWGPAHQGPPAVQAALAPVIPRLENILLLQLRVGLLFPLAIAIGLSARARDPGFHKRMMILATAIPLVAAIDRMHWLPTTFPASPVASDLWSLLAISPLFAWDVIRNRSVHRAYLVWLALWLPVSLAVYAWWDTPSWHSTAQHIMGVA